MNKEELLTSHADEPVRIRLDTWAETFLHRRGITRRQRRKALALRDSQTRRGVFVSYTLADQGGKELPPALKKPLPRRRIA